MRKIACFLTPPKDFRPAIQAAGCFLEHEGKILYLKRADGCVEGKTWCIPGGKGEKGELPQDTVVREIFEETAIPIDAKDISFLGIIYMRLPSLDYSFHVFHKTLTSQPELILKLDEHSEFRWLSLAEIEKLPLICGGYEVLDLLRSFKK